MKCPKSLSWSSSQACATLSDSGAGPYDIEEKREDTLGAADFLDTSIKRSVEC